MKPSIYVVMLGGTALIFAILLVLGARDRQRSGSAEPKASGIGFAALASINLAGLGGIAWFVTELVFYSGPMFEELSISTVLIAILASVTLGAFALKRRGRIKTAIAVLAIGALPTIAAFSFLVYLDYHPIDWR